jgi:hypothetical protein
VPVTVAVSAPSSLNPTANQTVCNNSINMLAVNPGNPSDYNSFVWSPAANLFTDAAATVPYVANSNAQTVYQRTTTAGLQTYFVAATGSCGNNDSTKVTTLPAAVTVNASPAQICQSGTTTLGFTPSGALGTAGIQWQESASGAGFADIAGANAASFVTPVLTSANSYQVVLRNGVGTICLTSAPLTINVNNPQVTSTTPGSRCSTGGVTLNATANPGSVLRWYAAATGGASLATGPSFATPSVTAPGSANYFVEAAVTTSGSATIGTADVASLMPSIFRGGAGNGDYRQQILYTASELSAAGLGAGNITALSVNVTSAGSAVYSNYQIRMAPVAASA